MPAGVSVAAPGLLGRGGGGVCGGRVLLEVSGAGVLDLGGVHYVLAVVGQLDVGLLTCTILITCCAAMLQLRRP